MARGTHSAIIEKTAPGNIRVDFYNVGSVLVKLILRKGERLFSEMLTDRKK
jgi:hypothetical protein